jgi:hypothetical protein
MRICHAECTKRFPRSITLAPDAGMSSPCEIFARRFHFSSRITPTSMFCFKQLSLLLAADAPLLHVRPELHRLCARVPCVCPRWNHRVSRRPQFPSSRAQAANSGAHSTYLSCSLHRLLRLTRLNLRYSPAAPSFSGRFPTC